MDEVEKIADAVLYEGYALFPYRADALKNRKRFNFGVVAPRAWAENRRNEAFFQRTECLISSEEAAFEISLKIRFLQIENRTDKWQTARKCEVEKSFVSNEIAAGGEIFDFDFAAEKDFAALHGQIEVSLEEIGDNLYQLKTILRNLSDAETENPDDVQAVSFLSAHSIFRARGGRFVSLLEPPEEFAGAAKACANAGVFPVLAGDQRARNCLLSSPVILYDFPAVSEHSFADFFDGTEIDELMLLSILALTDEEKSAIKNGDDKMRRMIEKIEAASVEDLLKLHAVMTDK